MGISKWNAGIIRPVAVAPTGPYQNSAAPGVWTLDQQAYWQKQGLWPTAGSVNPDAFIENLFSTYLFSGNSSTQTITNGIDLSGKGGMVWFKSRSLASSHRLTDTVRGAGKSLLSNSTLAEQTSTGEGAVTSFSSTGFVTDVSGFNSTDTYVSWTFREQAKFFDVVTYTGTGSTRSVSHNLGSVPGFIIVKNTSNTADWAASLAPNGDWNNRKIFLLNTSDADGALATYTNGFINTATSTTVSLTQNAGTNVNASGNTYVMYLFAHNAGGFGLNGTDNVISCGSYTTNGSGVITSPVNLGYEPQWILSKRVDSTGNWRMLDVMRGDGSADGNISNQYYLYSNLSNAESGPTYGEPAPTATGFTVTASTANSTYIYIAIRRGPMKTPTTGTTVFAPIARTGTGGAVSVTGVGFPPDMTFRKRSGTSSFGDWPLQDKLRGPSASLFTSLTGSEADYPTVQLDSFDQNGISYKDNAYNNTASIPYINYYLRRAPSFFDVVAGKYFGGNLAHNLGVVPELVIAKQRDGVNGWYVWTTGFTTSQYLFLNSTAAIGSALVWNTMTSTEIGLQNLLPSNTGIYYLFATCPGVSKVGSYTGTGALQTIDCGFAAGARFVLIKRTDSTGDWYVWDSARGISSGNDPYLLINSTAAEVTGTNYVDTTAVGFQVTAAAPAAINANGGTFIFLAVS